MALSLSQSQRQTTRLIMTPQMQQSIELLQKTTMELDQLAAMEMAENPFLELVDDEEDLSPEAGAAADDLAADTPPAAEISTNESEVSDLKSDEALASAEVAASETPELDAPDLASADAPAELAERERSDSDLYSFDASAEAYDPAADAAPDDQAKFDSVDVDWDDYYADSENPSYSANNEDEEERDFTQYTAIREGLYESLKRQLRLSSLSGRNLQIGEFLIGNLNEDGLFDCHAPALLSLLEVPPELLEGPARGRDARRVVAEWLGKPIEEVATWEDKQIWLAGMAHLLGTSPDVLAGRPRAEIESILLAKRLRMTREALAATDTRQRFLLAVARRLRVKPEDVEDTLEILQEFEPNGVCARDLQECLRLQCEALGIRNKWLYRILDDHLTLLQQKKYREIAAMLKCTEADVSQVFQILSKLEPKPGRSMSKESPRYITPDIYVKKIDNKYHYVLNEGDLGRMKIASRYRSLLNSNGADKEFAEKKLQAARWLIRNIEKRKSTILRVTEAIMTHQVHFLEKGIEGLRPLTLREVAEVVGMHESTIARVTTGKYVETPRGIFELKFFFSSGLETQEGDGASSRSIKDMILQMIGNENPKRPLSDQKIASMIESKGITIARRTVAKYREQMKILPAKLRKKMD